MYTHLLEQCLIQGAGRLQWFVGDAAPQIACATRQADHQLAQTLWRIVMRYEKRGENDLGMVTSEAMLLWL